MTPTGSFPLMMGAVIMHLVVYLVCLSRVTEMRVLRRRGAAKFLDETEHVFQVRNRSDCISLFSKFSRFFFFITFLTSGIF